MLLFFIFCFAAGIRLVFCFIAGQLYGPEGVAFDTIAQELLKSGTFGYYATKPTLFWPPGYPFFLSILFKLFGHHNEITVVLQSIFSAFLCIGIYAMAYDFFKDKIKARLASFMAVVYPLFIFMSTAVLDACLHTVLFFIALWMLIHAFKNKKTIYFIAAGVLLGLSSLIRSAGVLFPFLLAGIIMLNSRFRKDYAIKCLLFALVSFLCILPWVIRNYKVTGMFVPVQATSGICLMIGVCPAIDGDEHNLEDWYETAFEKDEFWEQAAEKNKHIKNEEVRHDHICRDAAIKRIMTYPLSYCVMFVKHLHRFIFRFPGQTILKKYPWIVYHGALLFHWFVLLFALLGFISMPANIFKWLLGTLFVYWIILHSILWGNPRWFTVLHPYLIILACSGVVEMRYTITNYKRNNNRP